MSAATQNEMERLRAERDEAIAQRDYLVAEYERAVKCGPQGFAHAAGHLYNAISNAKCDANAERFIAIQKERDAALEREQDKREHVHRLCLDYQSLCEKLEMSWERNAALAAHVERCHEVMRWVEQGPDFVTAKCRRGLEMLRNRQPATDLTHRDLIKQAEALELAESAMTNEQDAATMRLNAASLRQRAQELTP